MKEKFLESIKENPIITAINKEDQLEAAKESPSEIVFLLFGDLLNLPQIVKDLKSAGKIVLVHVDLIDGLSRNATALEYVKEKIRPDGIITTRADLIKVAKNLGLIAVQRFFLIDSLAKISTIEALKKTRPDATEIMPGLMPKIIKYFKSETDIPIIAGGLISEKSEVVDLIKAGVNGISTTNQKVWYM